MQNSSPLSKASNIYKKCIALYINNTNIYKHGTFHFTPSLTNVLQNQCRWKTPVFDDLFVFRHSLSLTTGPVSRAGANLSSWQVRACPEISRVGSALVTRLICARAVMTPTMFMQTLCQPKRESDNQCRWVFIALMKDEEISNFKL